jgi:predicted metal-dependent peptidase
MALYANFQEYQMSTKSTTQNQEHKSLVGIQTDPRIDAQAREKLVAARIALLLKAPFFGNLATRLKLINADEWCGTAATDGRNFYYNSEFIGGLPQRQIEFLFGHEVLHVVYDHMARREDRDPMLSNVAADYCVNADLLEQKIGEKIPVGLYNTKYVGWSYEQVYDDLYENAEKIDLGELGKMILDMHLDGEDGEGEGDSQGEGQGSGRPRLSDEERKQIRDEIKEAVISAAQTAGAGNVPAGVRRMIKNLTSPQLSWRELLPQQVQSVIKYDYTWNRSSRKGWHTEAVMPGSNYDQDIDICVSIDASGSMTDEMLKDIVSEIKGIMDSFQNFRLHLWSFDTQVYNAQVFTPDNLEDILEYDLQGGGGTTFECNWEYMLEHDIQPKFFVMFTDGYPNSSWGDANYCDTMFVIHGSTSIQSPFGITTYYELGKKQ